MKDRKELLQKLVSFDSGLKEIQEDLSEYDWDSEEELVVLSCASLIAVLEKYKNCEVTDTAIEEWANMVEGRDDIGFEEVHKDIINDTLFELANPLLTTPLTVLRASELQRNLLS